MPESHSTCNILARAIKWLRHQMLRLTQDVEFRVEGKSVFRRGPTDFLRVQNDAFQMYE